MTRILVTGASGLLGLNFALTYSRQHQVQNESIVIFSSRQVITGRAIVNCIHGKILQFQTFFNGVGDFVFILNYQNSHKTYFTSI